MNGLKNAFDNWKLNPISRFHTINLNPALRDKTEENKNNSRPLQELEQTQNKKKKKQLQKNRNEWQHNVFEKSAKDICLNTIKLIIENIIFLLCS